MSQSECLKRLKFYAGIVFSLWGSFLHQSSVPKARTKVPINNDSSCAHNVVMYSTKALVFSNTPLVT